MTLENAILKHATAELNKHEVPKGSNWGPDVQKYLISVGINFPASWCMAFVYWCHQQAANELQAENKMTRTGGVLNQLNHSPKYVTHKPQPGDVFIMEFAHGLGHTGIVEWVEGDTIHTIEGNTNDDGSREGYEVAKRTRKISTIKAFLRFY